MTGIIAAKGTCERFWPLSGPDGPSCGIPPGCDALVPLPELSGSVFGEYKTSTATLSTVALAGSASCLDASSGAGSRSDVDSSTGPGLLVAADDADSTGFLRAADSRCRSAARCAIIASVVNGGAFVGRADASAPRALAASASDRPDDSIADEAAGALAEGVIHEPGLLVGAVNDGDELAGLDRVAGCLPEAVDAGVVLAVVVLAVAMRVGEEREALTGSPAVIVYVGGEAV